MACMSSESSGKLLKHKDLPDLLPAGSFLATCWPAVPAAARERCDFQGYARAADQPEGSARGRKTAASPTQAVTTETFVLLVRLPKLDTKVVEAKDAAFARPELRGRLFSFCALQALRPGDYRSRGQDERGSREGFARAQDGKEPVSAAILQVDTRQLCVGLSRRLRQFFNSFCTDHCWRRRDDWQHNSRSYRIISACLHL